MLTVGDKFPTFSLTGVYTGDDHGEAFERVNGPNEGRWFVFVAWPKDFTFVCPTEILGYNDLYGDFDDRNTVLFGLSTDSDFVHLAWRKSRKDLMNISFGWLADNKHELSNALGILDKNEGVCLRATFIVDPTGVIRHVSVNDLSVGRDPKETLRVLDALQNGGLCPCGWNKGDETLG